MKAIVSYHKPMCETMDVPGCSKIPSWSCSFKFEGSKISTEIHFPSVSFVNIAGQLFHWKAGRFFQSVNYQNYLYWQWLNDVQFHGIHLQNIRLLLILQIVQYIVDAQYNYIIIFYCEILALCVSGLCLTGVNMIFSRRFQEKINCTK